MTEYQSYWNLVLNCVQNKNKCGVVSAENFCSAQSVKVVIVFACYSNLDISFFCIFFNDTGMKLFFFIIINSNKKNISGIFFQPCCIFFFFDLPDGSVCGCIPFQFDDQCRTVCIPFWQIDNIRKSFKH